MKKSSRRRTANPPPRTENPDLFPSYVAILSNDSQVARMRGREYFEMLATYGLNVSIMTPPEVSFQVRSPRTIIYWDLPTSNLVELAASFVFPDGCPDYRTVLILDCHFPIADPTAISVGSPILADNVEFLDAIPTMIGNLKIADAVTVPNPQWAADLQEAEPGLNVHVLPDVGDIMQFTLRFSEIASNAAMHRDRFYRDWINGDSK